MQMSEKKRAALYNAIADELINIRILIKELKLPAEVDFKLAQVANKIWDRQKQVLQLDKHQSK
jgi:hypothetical protein